MQVIFVRSLLGRDLYILSKLGKRADPLLKRHFTDLEENRVVAASADYAAAAVGRPVRNDLATEPSGRGHALRGAGSRRKGSGDQDQEDGKPSHPEDSKVALKNVPGTDWLEVVTKASVFLWSVTIVPAMKIGDLIPSQSVWPRGTQKV